MTATDAQATGQIVPEIPSRPEPAGISALSIGAVSHSYGPRRALIDINFISSQLNTLLQTEGVTVDSIPIFLTRNAVYGDFNKGQPVDCCIGGFHTAFETQQVKNKIFVQTFAFSTSLDSDVAAFVFGSLAKRRDTASSDIDLMIVSDGLTYADVFSAIEPQVARLGRPINPTVYSKKEWIRRLKEDSEYRHSAVAGSSHANSTCET